MKLLKQEIFKIIVDEFNKRDPKELSIYDEVLKEKLAKSPKTIQRYFEEFQAKYNSIVEVAKRKQKTYKLINPVDIMLESFDHYENIGWLFQMIQENDPIAFKDLEIYTKKDKHLYQFQTTPFEDIDDLESKQSFKRLKNIIQARDYAKLTFMYDNNTYDNLKCLKLVFMDNNWYIAYVDEEDKLKFGRISFIQRVDFATKSGHFQPSSVSKHIHFLEHSIQNSMTLYDVSKKTATIKANPNIARYFKKYMKKFLSTQKFIKEQDDGSIIFELTYTQPLEILPFVQKWLPDLVILEPQELKDEFRKKLKQALENL